MATTDAKPGFRLPWSADRSESEARAETTGDAPVGEAVPHDQEIETPDMIDAAPSANDQMATVDEGASAPSDGDQPHGTSSTADPSPAVDDSGPATEARSSGRKPNKFMADLTRAMQGAAETAKADTLARFAGEAKAYIETIHATTANEATELRKQADDDVASIREWSKAEIARIREETDERITHRKARLEREIEAHAADIEGRIERVQRRVDAFEAEMADFFQRLIAEEDATRFAAMAESLPEPPPFDTDDATEARLADAATTETDETLAERAVVVEASSEASADPIAENEATAATEDAPATDTETETVAEVSAEAPATADEQAVEVQAVDSEAVEVQADPEMAAFAESDPRLDALAMTPDFAAAEAEAAAFKPEESPAEEEITVIGDDALAARLAGLVPEESHATETHNTRVVVTGLVSVASIAGFKRQLSRVAGVHSVGVSSGPDGEFLFAVAHDPGIVLKDALTTLPGFGARVTAEAEGELTVTARDPENEG